MMFTKDDRDRLERIEMTLARIEASLEALPASFPPPMPIDTTEYDEPLRVDEADELVMQRKAEKAGG